MDGPTHLSLSAGAALVGLSTATLRRAVKSGALPAIKVGLGDPRCGRILIARIDLDQWVQAQRIKQPATAA